jgi:hypothetical protein
MPIHTDFLNITQDLCSIAKGYLQMLLFKVKKIYLPCSRSYQGQILQLDCKLI